jgi:hypothetical protein
MTVLKLGYTDPRTDVFGAHPVLGPVLDLNDGQTFVLVGPDGLALPPPARTLVPTGNIRTQGERGVKAIYRHNREVTCQLILGPGASYAALVASVRTLLAWVNAAPALPVTLQYQPFGASAPVYLDVIGCAHDLPASESDWLRLQLEPLELVFVCRPGLRGDRVTLSNLVLNPGFEQGSGPGVQVFNDTFVSTNAYALQAGGAPSVTANVMTLPNGTRVAFGSPAWGAIQQWTLRFQWITSLGFNAYLHYVDGSNGLYCAVSGTAISLNQPVGGVNHVLASAAPTLTNGNWYWLQITQFPAPPASTSGGTSDPVVTQAALFNDNAGALGTAVASGSVGPVATFDAVTALVGRPQIAVSGAFAGVHTLSLFGPGGWNCSGNGGTGPASGAWERQTANTYPNGPVTSLGAARLDLPPAGTVNANWNSYGGGAPANTPAIPVAAPGDVVYARVAVKSAGLGNGATVTFVASEWDASGNFLRNAPGQTLTIAGGVQLAWPAAGAWNLAFNWTTGASCAYVSLVVGVVDSGAGNSANATLWIDNAQCWDSTKVGSTTMPYCELRFAQSPAPLVLSGLVGDLPAPAQVQVGSYVSAWAKGGHLSYAVGRLGSYRPAAILTAPSHGFYGTLLTPQATPVLDGAGYGGFYVKAQMDSNGWQPRAFSTRLADALGVYHLLARFRSADASPTAVQPRVQADEALHDWYSDAQSLGTLSTYYGPYATPLSAANVWTVADAGQLALPPFPSPALLDATQLQVIGRGLWVGSGVAAEGDASWQCLLPVDGALLLGVVNFPSNNSTATMTGYVWLYADGLLVNQGVAASGPAASYSLETVPLPNASHAAGGAGTLSTGTVNVNSGADPYLTLDPTLGSWNGAGVNQAVGVVYDEQATVLPLLAEVVYSPLYLQPR